MTLAIIGLLTALVPLVFWWLKRRTAKKESPTQQHRERLQTINADLASPSAADLTLHGGADLAELERLRAAHGRRDE